MIYTNLASRLPQSAPNPPFGGHPWSGAGRFPADKAAFALSFTFDFRGFETPAECLPAIDDVTPV